MSLPSKDVAPRLQSLIQLPDIQKRFNEVLGKRAPSFISSILSAVAANPKLKEADPMSIISSAMIAASLDLPINASLGMAYIVPFKGAASFQIGWKGLAQLAMRSGQFRTLNATKVLEGQLVKRDTFTGEMTFQEEATSDKVIGYLLYFKLLNGFEKYHYWTVEECEAHGKKFSQTYKKGFGLWKESFDAMALKTVIKSGLSKYAPLSIDMQKAIESDQGVFTEPDALPQFPDNEAPLEIGDGEKKSRLDKIIEDAEILAPGNDGTIEDLNDVQEDGTLP